MDENTPSSSNSFNLLPIELNQRIGLFLETDADIASFSKVCRATQNAIWADNWCFWRPRFGETYDMIPNVTSEDLVRTYINRARYLGRSRNLWFGGNAGVIFSKIEMKAVDLIKDMILDSFKGPSSRGHSEFGLSLNQQALMEFCCNSRHFMNVKDVPDPRHSIAGLLETVRVMCAQLLLETEGPRYDIIPFGDAQKMVYSHKLTDPIFYGEGNLSLNMDWILHALSFFRHHFYHRWDAGNLCTMLQRDGHWQRPTAWRTPLEESKVATPIGKHWRGTYTYLEPVELRLIRQQRQTGVGGHRLFLDGNVDGGAKGMEDISFDCVKPGELPWPEHFEKRIQSLQDTMVKPTRPQRRRSSEDGARQEKDSIRIAGNGFQYDEPFFASGWINPLFPQNEIPGFQRITFMKHFRSLDHAQDDDLCAHEGVILPGGRVMVGRWWSASQSPDNEHYGKDSGPFILWRVEKPDTRFDHLRYDFSDDSDDSDDVDDDLDDSP